MKVDTRKVKGRRIIRFETIDDAIRDAEMVASSKCRQVGNWTVGQVLDHLARTLRIAFDGPQLQAPWFARTFVAPFMKRAFCETSMPSGFQFTKRMLPLCPDDTVETDVALNDFRKQFERLKLETPSSPHAFFGTLTREEWVGTQLRHCELHLSFLQPEPQ